MVKKMKKVKMEELRVYVNNNRLPVTIILPDGRRPVIAGNGKGKVTGPPSIMDRYIPVLTRQEVETQDKPKSPPSSIVVDEKVRMETQRNRVPGVSEKKQADDHNRENVTPFSHEEVPPMARGVDYNDPLTIDQMNCQGFTWNKVKKKNLVAFAEECLIDLEEAKGNRNKIIRMIRKTFEE